jgi:small subunit ribosomal protein S7|uniref:Small ribosomal subunit protein uS7c n=2 Tax=Heterosigma akashiwo TaxID=2829 RepID=B2XTC9_HETAK|nr:ribosomal protein S7 [Heterosigma akashiwo]ABV66027.1 30S ribosomal protein S7 [Heterosigma akashiwo]ABV70168.1 30S ribosomal protein S7 [Heterosigma akashiwo]BBA18233.1 30S ribosomal protein S7 [Heterosigma akashiwo]BBA18372.1 30S ribosomal protein S7 [Heterosigma akashiwo]BBA18511.1 30S ribosomal protein S7 [Heterosigma akashiwo]|mmetsp:Transcript_19614/g.29675  ORF Transcript_19614/g.29675 Transcript_19614/m.29675 type:complete len:157 (-) Transcript_19614:1984-2454(-)
MSRRNISRKNFPSADPVYNSLLVSLLTARILKSGKKTLARRIIKDVFDLIENRTSLDPLVVFEKAVRNVTPIVEVKACRVGGSTYQVPIEVSGFRGTNLSLRWIVKAARSRSGKTFSMKLANELIDASNLTGSAIRKKEETHKMAEANKAFAHFRY